MTIKEYNKIRAELYCAAVESSEEVKNALDIAGIAYIFELKQLPDVHKIITLTAKTQLNNNTIRANGFDPDRAEIRLLMTLRREAKNATIAGIKYD